MRQAPQVIGMLVGCRNYRGAYQRAELLVLGEGVIISRNAGNPVDFNAVQVHDAEGLMLGHLDAGTAAQIARFMDAGIVYLATVVNRLRVTQHPTRGKMYQRGSCLIRCTPLPPITTKKQISVKEPT